MSARISHLGALVLAGILQSGFCADSGQEAFSPEMPSIDHYEFVWKRSPFVRETLIVDPSEGLAQKYSLGGLTTINGEPHAVLIEKGTSNRIWIPKKGQQIELVSIKMERDYNKSTAVIRLGDETASISFDDSQLRTVNNQVPQLTSNMANGGVVARPPRPAYRNPPSTNSGTSQTISPAGTAIVPVPPPPSSVRPSVPAAQKTPPAPTGTDDMDAPVPTQRFLRRPQINTSN